ncbi:hypothetical protein GCM10023259_054790 [Thermocatellispora tengchongensis]
MPRLRNPATIEMRSCRERPSRVEQAAQQRFAVEAGQAQPRDRAVQADQRRGRAVPDEAEILQRQVALPPADRAERWIGI